MIVAEACLCFCVSEPNRDLAGEPVCLLGLGSLLFSAMLGPRQEGDVSISSSSSTGWICVDSGLPLSRPVLIPLCKLCCDTLQLCSFVHCCTANHP